MQRPWSRDGLGDLKNTGEEAGCLVELWQWPGKEVWTRAVGKEMAGSVCNYEVG